MTSANLTANCTTAPRGGELMRAQHLVTELQLESYEKRLSLQPNGERALAAFYERKDSPEHRRFQHAMGIGLWNDLASLGKDTIAFLREYGRHLLRGEVSVPSGLDTGFLHGLIVTQGGESRAVAMPPSFVSLLSEMHSKRYWHARNEVNFTDDSISLNAIADLDPRATPEAHQDRSSPPIPLLHNFDRIGVLLESVVVARLSESHLDLLSSGAALQRYPLPPLRLIDAPGDFPLISGHPTC